MEIREWDELLSGEEHSRQGQQLGQMPLGSKKLGTVLVAESSHCGWSRRWRRPHRALC